MKTSALALFLLACPPILPTVMTNAQVKRTEIPLGNALAKALESTSLTHEGDKPFHIRVDVSEPGSPTSPYQGTIEEWWASPQQWRREVTDKAGMRQTIVISAGAKTEEDTGDYFPNWLRSFVTAVFDPVPNAAAWNAAGMTIVQITMPNGARSEACSRAIRKVGTGDRVSNTYSNICFDADGHLSFIGSTGYDMSFKEFKGFGKRQIARRFVDDPESGTTVVGIVTHLEDLSKASRPDAFQPLSRNDNLFQSVHVDPAQLEALTAAYAQLPWPRVRSGNLHGHVALYLSTDRTGQVREAWPLSGDNGEIHDFARAQAITWRLKAPINAEGQPIQIEGPLSLSFDTTIGDPLPELTDPEVRALAIELPTPAWPTGQLHPGDIIQIQISVNEDGKLTGYSPLKSPPAAQGALLNAVPTWKFRPLLRNGKPEYFHGTLKFVIP